MSDVLERFLRYVQIDSESDPENFEQTPSTEVQHDMAKLLEHELLELGLEDVVRDEHAYVTASLPASEQAKTLPALGLIAHVDSAPSVPGSGVKPQVIHYEGGTLHIGEVEGRSIDVTPEDLPELADMVGDDIVCSDGSTLLAADDKAGVAEIMALLARLVASRALVHPTIKVAFVPDEEIGHGAELLELHDFGATWAYTVDGEILGEINYETFNAAAAEIKIHGVNVHPGSAKGIMVNAITLFREFDAALPKEERPEHTEDYEGFFHCTNVEGNESLVRALYILRDFSYDGLELRKRAILEAVAELEKRYPTATIEVDIHDEYRNMAEGIEQVMFLVENAQEANREVGLDPKVVAVRGGTDGSQLTFRGLPCPNLATGAHNLHSVRELISVQALEKTVDMLEHLVAKFAVEQRKTG